MCLTKQQTEFIIKFVSEYNKICCGKICEQHNRAVYLCPEYQKLLEKYGVENVRIN